MPKGDTDLDERSRLLEEAERLSVIFRQRALRAEEDRKVPSDSISDIINAGFPRACQPSRFGGAELPWDALVEISIVLGQGCGSQAWVADVLAEHNCLLGHFPDEAQHDVWDDDPSALISSAYAPTGQAKRVDGGWQISGKWGFSSGVEHCSWIILGILLPVPDENSHAHHVMLLPAADRKILDTWDAMGMRGTGSHDIEVESAFVPDHRVLNSAEVAAGQSPGAELNTAPVFRMPHLGYAQPSLAGVVVGIAAGAVVDFEEMLKTRKIRGMPLAEVQGLQLRFAEASAEVEAARLLVISTARKNMEILEAGKVLDLADLGRSRRNSSFAVKLVKSAVQRLFEATGGQGVYMSENIQRAFRDVQTAGAHIALTWDLNATIYSKQALGLDLSDVL